VQSSIAFTSIGHGNVPAAICAATFSTLIGVILTPILASLLLKTHSGGQGEGLGAIGGIFLELLLPFILGQLLRPWIADWAARNKTILKFTDRGSIILVVYTAFSAAVMRGIWHQLPLSGFAEIVISNGILLALVLLITTYGSRALGFAKPEEIAIVFCGSKKSAASGVPMANVLFGASCSRNAMPANMRRPRRGKPRHRRPNECRRARLAALGAGDSGGGAIGPRLQQGPL
jgi:sodium/bile acid cotransporter 7